MPVIIPTTFRRTLDYFATVMEDEPDGFWLMDDASGDGQFADSSGNGRHLTNMADISSMTFEQPSVVNNSSGNSVYFEGTNSARGRATSNFFSGLSFPFTLEFWVDYDLTGSMRIATHFLTDNYHGINVVMGTSGQFSLSYGDGGAPGPSSRRSYSTTGLNLPPNIPAHIVVVMQGNHPTLPLVYVNGAVEPVTLTSGTGGGLNTSDGRFNIGTNWGGGGTPSEGNFDAVAFYTKELTADRVQAHYDIGKPFVSTVYDSTMLSHSPVAYYKLNDAGDPFVDSSGNGHDAVFSPGGVPLLQQGNLLPVGADSQGDSVVFPTAGANNHYGIVPLASVPTESMTFIVHMKRTGDFQTVPFWYLGSGIYDCETGGITTDYGFGGMNVDKIYFGCGAPDVQVVTTATVPLNTVMQVAVTRDNASGEINFYFDGSLVQTSPLNPGIRGGANVGLIGIARGDGNDAFPGQLQNLAVFDRELSPGEIATIYAASL